MVKIQDRLVELLKERKIKHHLMDQPGNAKMPWIIQYKRDNGDGLGVWHFISPESKICDQDWMLDPIGWTSFEQWIEAVDKIFMANLGMTHDDFEDYNWTDEFKNDVEPEDAYFEWSKYNVEGFGR